MIRVRAEKLSIVLRALRSTLDKQRPVQGNDNKFLIDNHRGHQLKDIITAVDSSGSLC